RGVDERGDIYSLGVTLFEMLTGRRPYDGDDIQALSEAVLSGPMPRAKDLNPEVPDAVDAIVARAMARRLEDRYSSAAELASDRRRELDGSPTVTRGWRSDTGRRRVARRIGTLAIAGAALVAAVLAVASRLPPPAPVAPGSAVVAVLPLTNA